MNGCQPLPDGLPQRHGESRPEREYREVDAAAVLSLPLHQFHHHEGDRVQQGNGRAGRVGSRA